MEGGGIPPLTVLAVLAGVPYVYFPTFLSIQYLLDCLSLSFQLRISKCWLQGRGFSKSFLAMDDKNITLLLFNIQGVYPHAEEHVLF